MTRSAHGVLFTSFLLLTPAGATSSSGGPARHLGPDGRPRRRARSNWLALPHQVDVQLRRRLGHVRIRQLALQQSEGAASREPQRPVVRGLRQAGAVGSYTLASSSEIYGKVSAVGERTYGSAPAAVRRRTSRRSGRGSLHRLAIRTVARRSARTRSTSPSAARRTSSATACSVRRRGRGRQPRRLLDERAQGVRVRRDRPLQAGPPQRRSVLSRQGRARRERHRQPAVGHELRVHASAKTRRSARPT